MKSNYSIKELKDYIEQVFQKNKSKNKAINVYSVTNSEGFILSEDYFSKEVFSKDLSNYKLVKLGEFAYNPSRINVGSIDYLKNIEFALVSPLYTVFKTSQLLHPDYLLKFLKSRFGIIQINSKTRGAVRDILKFSDLEKIKIPLPFIEDQKRISHILGKVENLIFQRKQSLKQLDELIKSIFIKMFDPKVKKDIWEKKTIGDLVATVKYGTSASANGGKYKYLRMSNITYDGYWNFSDIKYIDINEKDYEKYVLYKNDLVFNRTNSKELVGKTAVYDSDEPVIIAGYLIRVRVSQDNNPWYIWGYLNSLYGKKVLKNLCRNIVGMANINANELQSIPILKAPLSLQNQFADFVKKIQIIMQDYQQNLSMLEQLYNSLSQKAFKGELNLTNVPIAIKIDIEAETEQQLKFPESIEKIIEFQERIIPKGMKHLYDPNSAINIVNRVSKLVDIPDYSSWQQSTAFDEEYEELENDHKQLKEQDIRQIFDNSKRPLSFKELLNKLEEKTSIGLQDYEFIKTILYKMLGNNQLEQIKVDIHKGKKDKPTEFILKFKKVVA